MPLWHAVILGIIQGLTEFLPVSSSAHLAVVPFVTGWPDQGLEFDIAVHFGTLIAVLAYFFRDWLQIITQAFGIRQGNDPRLTSNPKLLWLLIAATIPAGVIGFLFEKQAEEAGNNLYSIGTMLIVIGLFMWWADRRAGNASKDIGHVSATDAIVIGVSQALAVIPGTSRSGVTISTGLLRGLDRAAAARFSFLLSTPVIGGAALKKFIDISQHGLSPDMQAAFAVGIIVSGITGALSIRYFMAFLRHRTLGFFVTYRIVFGILVIALAIFRS
jgi:undecaprenyl-diphosphatase